MYLEGVDVFKFWVSSTYKLYLSPKIGCGHLLTKKVSIAREEKRCKGPNLTFRDQVGEDEPAKEEWPMR